ncbi:MAG: class I SAM-dependent methyltransferase [Rhodospirillales bacterium]|nr:class I SAM-dependent methyltransferase [Rhodospirillales bacterium]
MPNEKKLPQDEQSTPLHLLIKEPSLWIQRFVPLIPLGGTVLDLACGGGRNSRYLLAKGYKVVAVDRNTEAISDLSDHPNIEIITADLEDGSPWPFKGCAFEGVVTTNYLYRPLFQTLVASLKLEGLFLYETFANGNQEFRKPRNPDHLLKAGELLELSEERLHVVAYEHGLKENQPLPGVVQRICAVNTDKDTPYFSLNL